jgi:membrane associated rhomboid family serine protease
MLALVSGLCIYNWRTHHWVAVVFSAIVLGLVIWGVVRAARNATSTPTPFNGTYVAGEIAKPRAPSVRVLIGMCVAASFVAWTVFHNTYIQRWTIGSREILQDHEWWRLVTSAFLHASTTHLWMNMVALWYVGGRLESALGTRQFLMIYGAAALGGGLFVVAFGQEHTLGASGAIYGVMGADIALALAAMRAGCPSSARMYVKNATWLIGLNLLLTMAVPFISLAAHVGGLITGLLVTLGLKPPEGLREVWSLAEAFPEGATFNYDGDRQTIIFSGSARYAVDSGLVDLDTWVAAVKDDTLPPSAWLHELNLDAVALTCTVPVSVVKQRLMPSAVPEPA